MNKHAPRGWNLSDCLAIAGGLAVTAGAAWWSPAAGLVVFGLLLSLAALATSPKPRR